MWSIVKNMVQFYKRSLINFLNAVNKRYVTKIFNLASLAN